jgi:diguanylate cyclase
MAMDSRQRVVVRKTAVVTLLCIAVSLVISTVMTYVVTGHLEFGLGGYISILIPAIIAPIGSYTHISLASRLREANELLRSLSETDPLTQTCNRRRFLEVAVQQLALAQRHCFPTSLLLIDFDHFKQINDRLGHVAGDRVLVDATRIMSATLRQSDTLARFGGEEFIVLLPHTAREGAQMVAERMMAAIRSHEFLHGGEAFRVTVSVGGVTCETSETTLDTMTSKADRQLYASKQAGRDRCMIETLPRLAAPPLRSVGKAGDAPARPSPLTAIGRPPVHARNLRGVEFAESKEMR